MKKKVKLPSTVRLSLHRSITPAIFLVRLLPQTFSPRVGRLGLTSLFFFFFLSLTEPDGGLRLVLV